MAKLSSYALVGSILDADIISLLRSNGDGTYTNYTVNFAATKAAQTVSNLNSLTDVDLTVAALDRQTLVYDLSTTSWKAGSIVSTVTTKTASAILALTDVNTAARGVVRMNSATGVSLTVPPEATVAFPIGTQIEVTQSGAGLVTLAAGIGVTVNSAAALISTTQHQKGLLTKTGADTWNFLWLGASAGGSGIPNGGTAGQTLVKQSGTNGDAVWAGAGNTTGAPSAGAHAYWRIAYVSGNHGTFLSAFDIQFRQTAGVTEHPTGGSVIEFHTRGGFAGSDAFDANDSTRWALDDYGNISTAYVGYHYATPISVAQVRMLVSNGETPNSYNIQYSDNGTTWTTALAVTGQTNWATEVLHNMPLTTTYGLAIPVSGLSDAVIATPADGQVLTYEAATSKWKNKAATGGGGATVSANPVTIPNSLYARVMCDAGSGYFAYAFAEVIFTDENGADIPSTGATAIASGNNSGQTPNLAFDGNNSTFWAMGVSGQSQTASQWVGLQFPTAKKVLGYKLRARGDGGSAELQSPLQHGLEISTNGTIWTRVASFGNTAFGVGEQKTFALTLNVIPGTGSWVPPRCRLTRAANLTGTNSFIPVPWTTEIVDDLNAHDNTTNPERITIPAGVTKARFHIYTTWENFGGNKYLNFVKNGTTSIQTQIFAGINEGSHDFDTGWISVTPGDYFVLMMSSGQIMYGTTSAASYGGGSYIEAEFDNGTNGTPSVTSPAIVQYKAFCQADGPFVLNAIPTPGNLLVCMATHWVTAITINSDWTTLLNYAGTNDGNVAMVKIVDGNDTATLAPFTGAGGTDCVIYEISGALTAIPLAKTSNKDVNATTNTLKPGVPADNSLLIGFWGTNSANTAPTIIDGVTGIVADTPAAAAVGSGSPRRSDPFHATVNKGQSVLPKITYPGAQISNGIAIVLPPA